MGIKSQIKQARFENRLRKELMKRERKKAFKKEKARVKELRLKRSLKRARREGREQARYGYPAVIKRYLGGPVKATKQTGKAVGKGIMGTVAGIETAADSFLKQQGVRGRKKKRTKRYGDFYWKPRL